MLQTQEKISKNASLWTANMVGSEEPRKVMRAGRAPMERPKEPRARAEKSQCPPLGGARPFQSWPYGLPPPLLVSASQPLVKGGVQVKSRWVTHYASRPRPPPSSLGDDWPRLSLRCYDST